MWIVYNRQDSWECGISVKNEAEAIRRCKMDENLTYRYICIG